MSLTQVQGMNPRKNKFNLSHEHKLTMKMGEIVPILTQEVIPGDKFRVNTQSLIKFAPLLSPTFNAIDLKIDFFFVPYRILWDEWKDFITGGSQGDELPSHPRVKVDTTLISNKHLEVGTLSDYLGVPVINPSEGNWDDTNSTDNVEISLLPFRAYQLIYQEYFADQNFDEFNVVQYTSSGILSNVALSAVNAQLKLRKTTWAKDYFTSALPFLQRGPAVSLPLTGNADVKFDVNRSRTGASAYDIDGSPWDANHPSGRYDMEIAQGTKNIVGHTEDNPSQYDNLIIDNSPQLYTDLEGTQAVTINDLRRASALQRFLEMMAKGGGRYREQIQTMFGERIPDYTIQIPQYLGGGRTPVQISEIVSTYQNNETIEKASRPQGDQTGLAQVIGDNTGFSQKFVEHGVILGLARVVPKASYSQGLHRMWTRFDKFDHFFPHFANLGEQEVKNSELFCSGDNTIDNGTFGYQSRYAEYKYAPSNNISGQFHTTLSFWEMSRRFNSTPYLNKSFLECTPTERIFAVTDPNEDKIWAYFNHQIDALRPIPYHANPSLS